ncbi:hypothetical protein GUJ93_ZPchr0003g16984 [Zizania palustris]|uniref:Uncharacterized protein n=1 Tax=Zizania palustris TaxID=103762 RepID=A0A8J5RMG8_ZIZPA|nr:hypothetical protein GUJ93_ZPchr0003g16984 [Zizania palustris]
MPPKVFCAKPSHLVSTEASLLHSSPLLLALALALADRLRLSVSLAAVSLDQWLTVRISSHLYVTMALEWSRPVLLVMMPPEQCSLV